MVYYSIDFISFKNLLLTLAVHVMEVDGNKRLRLVFFVSKQHFDKHFYLFVEDDQSKLHSIYRKLMKNMKNKTTTIIIKYKVSNNKRLRKTREFNGENDVKNSS